MVAANLWRTLVVSIGQAVMFMGHKKVDVDRSYDGEREKCCGKREDISCDNRNT